MLLLYLNSNHVGAKDVLPLYPAYLSKHDVFIYILLYCHRNEKKICTPSFAFFFHFQALQERIKFLENAQGTSVQALINRITNYGGRRLEDFNKYEALRLAEELVSVAKTTGHAKAASYDIITTTLREKIHVAKEQSKAYFLALLADKEFTRIFDTISKVDKSLGTFRSHSEYD